jgi:hypothetical protein
MATTHPSKLMTTHDEAIEACQVCMIACGEAIASMAAKGSSNDCPLCCRECENACTMTIKSLAADSPMAVKIARLCAEICDWCREECDEQDDETCQACAKACDECANTCRGLA